MTNGTAAIDVAVEALDIGPGDEVILPSYDTPAYFRLSDLEPHQF